jgi:hypothetical protein
METKVRLASGEFDGTGVAIDDKYQSIQVSNYI